MVSDFFMISELSNFNFLVLVYPVYFADEYPIIFEFWLQINWFFIFFLFLILEILISCFPFSEFYPYRFWFLVFFLWFLSCLIVSSWCWCTLIVDDLSNRFLSRTAARTHLSLSCYPPLADGIIHYPLWRTRFVNIYKR